MQSPEDSIPYKWISVEATGLHPEPTASHDNQPSQSDPTVKAKPKTLCLPSALGTHSIIQLPC